MRVSSPAPVVVVTAAAAAAAAAQPATELHQGWGDGEMWSLMFLERGEKHPR